MSVYFLKVRMKLVEGQSVRTIQETGAWHLSWPLSIVAEQLYLLGAVDTMLEAAWTAVLERWTSRSQVGISTLGLEQVTASSLHL